MKLIHKSFCLNGENHSKASILKLANSWLLSEFLHKREIAQFFIDWFSDSETIVVQTSGSTGVPKTIHLQKKAMIASAKATGAYFNLQANQTALLCLSANYIAGKMMLVRALVLGLHIDVVATSSNPLDTIEKQYDFVAMVPLQVANSIKQLHLVKTLIIGGATVSNELQTVLLSQKCNAYETYGMTETISHIAVKRVGEDWFHCLPNITIEQDATDCLIIHAPRIIKEPVITTDIVTIQGNSFKWLGRKDNIINSGGIKFQPESIEKKLAPFITKPFYISSKKDTVLGEKLVLVLESEEEFTLDFKMLDKYETPKEIIYLKEFQKTSSGKVKREKF